jgi:hypothetical protein
VAMVSSIEGTARFARATLLAVRARFTPVAKPQPACGKHHLSA